ncbi:MAG: universal stress protein [Pirellulaceae bacterium]
MFGDPGSEITRFAKENDAGLIVISSHGRTGVSRLLLGSVAERVVRLAPCPVLVLRDDSAE